MSEPIKVGDLVRVVRACDCKPLRGYGTIFMVEKIETAFNLTCKHCSAVIRDGRPLAYGTISKGSGWHPLAWLRRIPPLSELDDVRQDEEITA
jgi:hypothetical protein